MQLLTTSLRAGDGLVCALKCLAMPMDFVKRYVTVINLEADVARSLDQVYHRSRRRRTPWATDQLAVDPSVFKKFYSFVNFESL